MTKFIREHTKRLAPYVPRAVKDNWITILAFITVALLSWGTYQIFHLAHQNTARINDIQNARMKSCERTYHAIQEVIDKLTPPRPTLSAQQKSNYDTVTEFLNGKIAACDKQTETEK